jgi:hypothetical protein
MADDIHDIYAIRYGHHDRKSSENFIGGDDPHDLLQRSITLSGRSSAHAARLSSILASTRPWRRSASAW